MLQGQAHSSNSNSFGSPLRLLLLPVGPRAPNPPHHPKQPSIQRRIQQQKQAVADTSLLVIHIGFSITVPSLKYVLLFAATTLPAALLLLLLPPALPT